MTVLPESSASNYSLHFGVLEGEGVRVINNETTPITYTILGTPTSCYEAKVQTSTSSTSCWATPLVCRADNGVVVIVEDELGIYTNRDLLIANSVVAPIYIERLTANENGCITLDVFCETSLPSSNSLYCNVMYYIPSVQPDNWLAQSFPIKLLSTNHFRIGFKTFYNSFVAGNSASEDFYTGEIQDIWICFNTVQPLGFQ